MTTSTPVKKMSYEELEAAYIQVQNELQIAREMNEYRQSVIQILETDLVQATNVQ